MAKLAPQLPMKLIVNGFLIALALGTLLGCLRYWTGFFVLAQGVCLGLLTPWLAIKTAGGQSPEHPGVKAALGIAVLWFISANSGLMLGFGLAQPWFEPLGWLGRIMDDDTAEFVFGVASTGGFSRGVAMGAQGGFWLVLNAIDWAIMFFFMWIMPWNQKGAKRAQAKKAEAAS
jgi:hypothetical protein